MSRLGGVITTEKCYFLDLIIRVLSTFEYSFNLINSLSSLVISSNHFQWQVYMFSSAYEPIQASQLMEELLGRVKRGFWTFTGLNFKWKHEHKQWEHHFARGGNSPCQMTNFAKGFSSWCEIWPFCTMKKPPCEISQGGFSPCEIWTLHLFPFENAFEILCFSTHAPPTSQIFLA